MAWHSVTVGLLTVARYPPFGVPSALDIRHLACTEQIVLEHQHWSRQVSGLQTAYKNALTCTAIAEGGCFGTNSALAVLDGFASSLGYSHTTRVFDVSQCLSASR
jgi:hypothetical protein